MTGELTVTNEQQEASAPAVEPETKQDLTPWIEALRWVGQHYRLSMSVQTARLSASWSTLANPKDQIRDIARVCGLQVKFADSSAAVITSWRLPVIVLLDSGQVGVVTSLSTSGEAGVVFHGDDGLETPMPAAELFQNTRLVVIARPLRAVPDSRVDTYIRPYKENWLRRIVLRDLRPYGHVMIASLVTNCLGLAGIMFSMQVYDRVVPAESFPTLYVLFGGVLLAIFFAFVMRLMRTSVVDLLGKRADLRMSDRVMGHALRVRNRARPASTGTFIAQIRDLEQVREMLTSTTVTAIADLPFFLLFLVIIAYLSGILVLIPIGALLLMIVPALLVQRKLRAHAREAMREASLRNAMLVEAVQGIEDIKILQAEDRFQQHWNHLNAVTGEAQIQQRKLTNFLNTWSSTIQNGVFAAIVLCGAPLVIAGDMTTGALVAASIMGSRMMAPLGQVAQLLNRLQHARVAVNSLDQIMKMPIDHPEEESRIHCPAIKGKYDLKSTTFSYSDDNSSPALSIHELRIKPGEKIAVLGKNGAGKSTLLQALSGLLEPATGEVLLDDLALQHIDPADVRRDVGLLTQNSRLFHGTLRDNILMGAPNASMEELLGALSMTGAVDFISKLPQGLDHMILEGGRGLSGGQLQAILLARIVIRQPKVILLDEPTASMDEAAERCFIDRFGAWSRNRTIVIATHRMRILDLVDRIIAVENGRIVLDETKDKALLILRGLGGVKPVQRSAKARRAGSTGQPLAGDGHGASQG